MVTVDGNRIQVAMGALKMTVKKKDLMALKLEVSGESTAPKEKKSTESVVAGLIDNPSTRCDLRGARADDALSQLEGFLDQSFNKGAREIMVIHGHGTGVLKRVIRESLEISPYVQGFRPGKSHEGGDGVTVVHLDS